MIEGSASEGTRRASSPSATTEPSGDTFTKTFEIKGIRNTSDKERSTYDFTCRLVNQRGKVCMECDRTTLFPFFAPPSLSKTPPPEPEEAPKSADRLRDHVVKQSEKLGEPSTCFWLLPLARFSKSGELQVV